MSYFIMTFATKCNLIYLIIIILFNICKSDDTIELPIKQGVLLGKVENTFFKEQNYYAFRGIPYARPPVDSLRFKPPIEHDGWEGTYEAFDNKPTCYQYNHRPRLGEDFTTFGSEDCLYLSVFSPNLEKSLPVLVFDYNDDFRSGVNGTDIYSPDFFLEEDVVVVTITHRLGIFGYLTTNDDVIPPNAGLKDFLMGLKWVKDNIGKFGGDPDRVTLMGNRGGGILAEILLYSEKAKGLFGAAILQSGTAFESTFFDKNPREKAFKIAKAFKIETQDSKTLLEELQKLDAKSLISKDGEAVDDTLMDNYQISIFPFTPTVEENGPDAVLTTLPENGNIVNDVPIIIGMNSREGLDLVSHYIFEPRLVADMGKEFLMMFPIRVPFAFDRKSSMYDQAIREILDFYFEEGYFYFDNILEYAVYVADILQNYALNFAAKKLSKELESSVFYYMFDFRGFLNENTAYINQYARSSIEHWGATLGDDLCYLQYCKRIQKTYEQLQNLITEPRELKVLKKMIRLWTNFIKNRNPTPQEDDDVLLGFKWEPIDKNSQDINYLHITKTLRMSINPLGKREKFWDEFLDKYSQLAIDGVVANNNKSSSENHDEL